MATQLNDWLSIDKVSGTGNAEITLTASSYSELVDRVTSLKIQAQTTNAILNVRQTALVPSATLDSYEITAYREGTYTNGITSNVPWTAVVNGDWITIDKIQGESGHTSLSITLDANTETRNGSIIFNAGGVVLTLQIYQIYDLSKSYFWIELKEAGGTINVSTDPSVTDIYYSFDGTYWSPATENISMGDKTLIFFKNNTKALTDNPTGTYLKTTIFNFDKYGRVGGDLSSLTDMKESCCVDLFKNNVYLTDASELVLPWGNLASDCYESMFEGCTSLVTAPTILPAIDVAAYCYQKMFYGCTSLVNAPKLPGEILWPDNYCYESMFQNCTSLVNAPALPSTKTSTGCYSYMFAGCTSLVNAPVLPAKALESYCYSYMFDGCTSLNYIKMLATNLGPYVASGEIYVSLMNWVHNVSSIGTFVKNPYPSLPRGFSGIPSGWTVYKEGDPNIPNPDVPTDPDVPNTEELKQQYFWVEFEEAGGELTFGIGDYTDIEYSFDGNTWNKFPYPLSMGEKRLVYLKNNTKKLSKKGEGNTYSNVQLYLYSKARVGGDFSSMTDMTPYCAVSFLQNQTNLTDASKLILPWKTLAEDCYFNMFYNCTSLTTAPELPATTLANECYYYMFYGCTSLTTAPELPAATLFKLCYYKMFNGCTTLNYIKMLGVDISNTSLKYWVENVAPTGTFVKHPDANIPTGTSGIPDGWTVETATS